MTIINPTLSIQRPQSDIIYKDMPYALLVVDVVAEDLEKSGHLKVEEGIDDLDYYTAALGTVEGIAFHFLRYRNSQYSGFGFFMDSEAFKPSESKNFQPFVLAYRLLEQLEIPWDKVNWVNPELQSPLPMPAAPLTY